MSASKHLRVSDIRSAYLLAGECRDLGDDPFLWRRHWAQRAAALVDADLVAGGEIAGVRAGHPNDLGNFDWGWENGFNKVGWDAAVFEFRDHPDLILTPPLRRYLRQVIKDDGVALARSDLMADGAWYRSWNYRELNSPSGVDHTVWCFGSLPLGDGDELGGILICRASGRRDYTLREKAIIRELQAVITPMIGGPLARFNEPSPSSLPQRVREVLRCLLEGDSDKQIASRLQLSRYTVNEYVNRVFRHFGVQSRPELLARWLRRGYGVRFEWSNPDDAL